MSHILKYVSLKIDYNKNWDIEKELKQISYSIFNENNYHNFKKLSHINLDTFESIKNDLKLINKKYLSHAKLYLNQINEFILENNIKKNIFYHHSIDKLIRANDVSSLIEKISINETIERKISSNSLFKKENSLSESDQKYLFCKFNLMYKYALKYQYNKIIPQSITPITLMDKIFEEIEITKKKLNTVFISDFGFLINKHIKNLPIPYIYEKIGEKFKYYLFDEFQDTSNIQWQNFQPLIENAIANNGNAIIVGDPKQSIYRWRSANIDIFMNIINDKKNEIISLKKNYRSNKNIVDFVNSISEKLSQELSKPYNKIFETASQEAQIQNDGLVKINLVENNEVNNMIYETVQKLLDSGFSLSDISILTRKNNVSEKIALFLSEKNIVTILSDSPILKNCSNIKFIISIFRTIINTKDYSSKKYMLCFIANKMEINDVHNLIFQNIKKNINEIFSYLKTKYKIPIEPIRKKSLTDIVENIIKDFNLEANSHLFSFLDKINEFEYNNDSNIYNFLEYWELNQDYIKIDIPNSINALKIMTIHKAKGLEFPAVIIPMINWKENSKDEIWVDIEHKSNSIPIKIPINKITKKIHKNKTTIEAEQKKLDNVNLLYVAITRAVKELHIICCSKTEKKDISKYFKNYINENQNSFQLGKSTKQDIKNTKPTKKQEKLKLTISNRRPYKIITYKSHDDTSFDNAFHKIMKNVLSQDDINNVIDKAIMEKDININDKNTYERIINKIVSHKKLYKYYNKNIINKNETEILNKDGSISRPDKVSITKNNIYAIIDYKTGEKHKKHIKQLEEYEINLLELGAKRVIKNLVYVNFESCDIDVFSF